MFPFPFAFLTSYLSLKKKKNLWGSFGKMTNSKRKTEPRYGFGTSTRDQQE